MAQSTKEITPPTGETKTSEKSLAVHATQSSLRLTQQRSSLPGVPEAERSGGQGEKAGAPELERIGLRGYLRLLRIFSTFGIFAARIIIHNFRWFGWKKTEPTSYKVREGVYLRGRLLALGPTFIKIGQTLATRADLLPVEYIEELSKLQDEVPPFSTERARAIIESEIGGSIPDVFASFEDQTIAAASLGQVHRARLKTGEDVVVKVQRPDLEKQISFDISVLQRLARFLSRYPNLIRGLDWEGALGEFKTTIFQEMDYAQEARNAEIFRSNFAGWNEVYVPRIHHYLCSRRVIVMEYIPGLKVTDVDQLKASGRNPSGIVRLLARTYLKQLLEDGFFHADPHPGNLRVMPDGRLAFFDFGMVGRLGESLQSKLINAFFHTVERDVHGLVNDMIRLGFIELTAQEEERFVPIIEGLLDRYLSLRLEEVQFKELIFDVAHVIYEFPFHIPASFTYIIRAMMTLEGIGTLVDPKFSFFEVAKPYAKRFMFKREARYLRKVVFEQVIMGNGERVDWGKIWKLGKMLFKYYIRGENRL